MLIKISEKKGNVTNTIFGSFMGHFISQSDPVMTQLTRFVPESDPKFTQITHILSENDPEMTH